MRLFLVVALAMVAFVLSFSSVEAGQRKAFYRHRQTVQSRNVNRPQVQHRVQYRVQHRS